MEDAREIISVQVGGFSNWVGSHRWNMLSANKEDEDRELFICEPGGTSKPRVAIFDLRNRRGGLFMPETIETNIPPWSSDVDQFCTELHPKLQLNWDEDPFVDLTLTELVWSDFMGPTLKESSFTEVPFWDVRNGDFSSYSSGDFNNTDCELSMEFREHCFDVIRLLLEDCDQPQGCECTLDVQGGFAGLGNSIIAEFRDQCRSAAITCEMLLDPPKLPTDPPTNEDVFQSENQQDNSNRVNSAMSVVNRLLTFYYISN